MNEISDVQLSRHTVAHKILKQQLNRSCPLTFKTCEQFSVESDVSCDIYDKPQLAIFGRYL